MMPMMFIWPILWIAVIGLIVWAMIAATGKKRPIWRSEESALEILKRSYARGEITKDEFESKKKDLV
jgi:putative membrane protein